MHMAQYLRGGQRITFRGLSSSPAMKFPGIKLWLSGSSASALIC